MFFTYPVPPPAVLSASRQRTAMRGGAWGRRTGVGAPAEDLDARAVLRVAHRDVVHEHVRDDVRLPRVLALDRERDGRQRAERARRTCPRLPTEMPCEPLHHMFCTTMLVEFGLNACHNNEAHQPFSRGYGYEGDSTHRRSRRRCSRWSLGWSRMRTGRCPSHLTGSGEAVESQGVDIEAGRTGVGCWCARVRD